MINPMNKEKFYYFRDADNNPLVTVCLMKRGEDISRGISICSFRDSPNKTVGRAIARGRAVKALCNKMSSELTERWEVYKVMEETNFKEPTLPNFIFLKKYKSAFNPKLSEFETSLLKVKK